MKVRYLIIIPLFVFTILFADAKIKGPFVYSEIYSKSGVITNTDSIGIKLPKKHEPITLIENVYTKRAKKGRKIEAEEVDSLVAWMRSSPEFRHTFINLSPYGWCWQLERNPLISLYVYSKKGYRIWGNGGAQACGKYILVIVKDGVRTEFKNTHKSANDKFRRELADMVSDDPVLSEMILQSRTRRDKTLRMLSLYNPVN